MLRFMKCHDRMSLRAVLSGAAFFCGEVEGWRSNSHIDYEIVRRATLVSSPIGSLRSGPPRNDRK